MKKIILSFIALASCFAMTSCNTSQNQDNAKVASQQPDDCGCHTGCGCRGAK